MSKFDFATGKSVNLQAPEEQVRQAYERLLHKDLGYPKECMGIEVPIPMGSSTKLCDIAVYETPKKDRIIGIVETKKPKTNFEKGQLASYMSATASCLWGVWTNGNETHCARREKNAVVFSPAFSVPRYGEREVTIRNYKELVPASNLKLIFRQINHRLYTNTNLPRSEKQGAEMVRLIFCKLMDEYNIRDTKKPPEFQILPGEGEHKTRARIQKLWEQTRDGYIGARIFATSEKIVIDNYSLQLIISMLQGYSLLKTDRDFVGDAFEIFAERQFAGEKGQFFTPRAVVKMIIRMIAPRKSETIIDPACGSGGFLITALNHIAGTRGEAEKRAIAEHCLYGIDKDGDLAKICKAQMNIIGDGKSNIITADSLMSPSEWGDFPKEKILSDVDNELRQFDVVVTNPPFGSKIKEEREKVLKRYDLGHVWQRKGGTGRQEWKMTDKTKPTPPQVLFIELCLRLLKPGGRMGIVLPDGLLGNPTDGYIRQWLESKADVVAVIDCPTATFMPHTGTKTSVLVVHKRTAKAETPFMAIAENCGHTYRGKEIREKGGRLREDFTAISENYLANRSKSHWGFRPKSLRSRILVPRYYDPRILNDIRRLERENTATMTSVAEMQEEGLLWVRGAAASAHSEDYDLRGEVRFVRTSDIATYEIYKRTQKNVSEEVYQLHKETQDLQIGDILFVKDGDDKIGETAILQNREDCRILVQTHFKILRAAPDKLDPFLLLWLLNTPIVRRQIRQRVFNQSTLSTIGDRIMELRLPVPVRNAEKKRIAAEMRKLLTARQEALCKIRALTDKV